MTGRITLALALTLVPATAGYAQQPPAWRLVEEWRVGGEADGPHAFLDVRALAVFDDGRIAVAEAKDQQIHLLDGRNGRALRSLGRRGGGPGEFQQLNGLVVTPRGELIASDPRNDRLTRFLRDGDLIDSHRSGTRVSDYRWSGWVDAQGRVHERLPQLDPAGPEQWKRRTPDLAGADTITVPPCVTGNPAARRRREHFDLAVPGGRASVPVPFAAAEVATALAPHGAQRWDGDAASGVLTAYPISACDTLAVIRLSGRRIPVPADERDRAVAGIREWIQAAKADLPDLSVIPREYPMFETVHTDAAGGVWVSRRRSDGDRTWEVFSSAGRPLAQVPVPAALVRHRPFVILADRLIGFTRDEDDVMYLTSWRIAK